jgi:RNA polymerase sigma factor (sigma-70 family)
MVNGRLSGLLPARREGAGAERTDEELLARFVTSGEESAFAELVRRHGPMVLGVCRRVLNAEHDAEDAFQATFLVLARRARAIHKREAVGSWLYGVAYRIAARARSDAARRRKHEGQVGPVVGHDPLEALAWRELRPVLDEELARLPAKYRNPLVLCYLEGLTNTEAAQQLGWTKGTVSGRLARARDLLRGRLARRGLALTSAILAALLAQNTAVAAVPVGLQTATVAGATSATASALAAGFLSPRAVELAALALSRKKMLATVVFLLAFLGAAGAGFGTGILPNPWQSSPPAANSGSCHGSQSVASIEPLLLLGAWRQESKEQNGITFKNEDRRAVFLERTVTLITKDGKKEWGIAVDPKASPKTIDVDVGDGSRRLGLYALKDNNNVLHLCLAGPGGERPTQFAGKAGTGNTFYVFKKESSPTEPGCGH